MCGTQSLSRRVAGSEAGKWQESEDGEVLYNMEGWCWRRGGDEGACAERM